MSVRVSVTGQASVQIKELTTYVLTLDKFVKLASWALPDTAVPHISVRDTEGCL